MNMNRRPIVGLVVAVLVILGVIGISNASYQTGLLQGMAQGTQIVVPNENGDGTRVVPAVPGTGAYRYPAPYYGGRPFGFGMGGFGILGFFGGVLKFLLIGGLIFFVLRLVLRGAFGWGRWGRGGMWGRGWGGPGGPGMRGPWGRNWRGWNNDDANKRDDFQNAPNTNTPPKRDDFI